ncbi:MAG: hypothetical protein J6J72_02210, partial [Tyzzerella sp.]|nr:hypothetical protein [Tyzzerella sp.]
IVGCLSGSMVGIYSNAVVVSDSTECGGLIGLLTGNVVNTISKCWFNGSVQGLRQTGGIIRCSGSNIMKAYDTDGENYTPTSLLQNIDVFAAFHHGKNMSMKLSALDTSFIDYLTYGDHTFDYVLYPCSLVYGDASDPALAFPYAGEVNTYLNSKANAYAHFGNGNVEITLNGATTE